MEHLKDILKKTGWTSIIESLIFIALGIILAWKPDQVMAIIAYIIGIVFIVIGIIKMINYVQDKGKSDLFNYELVYGIMSIVIGILVMAYNSSISKMFGIIIGLWIIYSAVVRASSALELRALSSNIWIYTLIIAIVMFICGLYVTLNQSVIVTTIGIIMIVYGIMDIAENIIFLKNVKQL